MTESPSTPPDPQRDPDWGRRRRGTPAPPTIGSTPETPDPPPATAPDLGREPSERQRAQDQTAADEASLRAEWDAVNAEWDRDRSSEEQASERTVPGSGMPDLSALLVLLDTLRSAAPVELQERTTALIREVLLTLRALIDWYLERLERPDRKPEVQDIPID